jgi:hypothetical protein
MAGVMFGDGSPAFLFKNLCWGKYYLHATKEAFI